MRVKYRLRKSDKSKSAQTLASRKAVKVKEMKISHFYQSLIPGSVIYQPLNGGNNQFPLIFDILSSIVDI